MENAEREAKMRKCGVETVEYFKDKKEQERIMKEGMLEVKKKEIDMKENMEEDEMKLKRRKLQIRGREQSMREMDTFKINLF